MDEREAKLPVWARDEINRLRRTVEDQANALSIAREEARKDGCTGKVIADGMLSRGFPLHDRAIVEFHLPDGKVSCMLRENGAVLDLNCSGGAMIIRPRASNSAYIAIGD